MTCKESNRPLPVFSEDEVVDYLVTEAIIMKAGRERQEHEENEKRKAWRKDHQALVSKSAGMGKL